MVVVMTKVTTQIKAITKMILMTITTIADPYHHDEKTAPAPTNQDTGDHGDHDQQIRYPDSTAGKRPPEVYRF